MMHAHERDKMHARKELAGWKRLDRDAPETSVHKQGGMK